MIFTDSKLGIHELIKSLNSSEPVVIPTETVYGLAGRIDDLNSLKKIFLYKKRPFFDPLIVHIHHKDQVKLLSQFDSLILDQLIDSFWPGPLTLVLPKTSAVSELITSGLGSVGIRMPKHPLALELLKSLNIPLAAPSANLFGQTSPTRAEHVEVDFPHLKILDGGSCEVGIESTVLKLERQSDDRLSLSILRKGLVTQSAISLAISKFEKDYEWTETISAKDSPGHMKHHYMPKIPIVFFDRTVQIYERLATIQNDFKSTPNQIENVELIKPKGTIHRFERLSFGSDPLLACRELYCKLKSAADTDAQILVFEKQSYMKGELWEAFLERLTKASSLRYTT